MSPVCNKKGGEQKTAPHPLCNAGWGPIIPKGNTSRTAPAFRNFSAVRQSRCIRQSHSQEWKAYRRINRGAPSSQALPARFLPPRTGMRYRSPYLPQNSRILAAPVYRLILPLPKTARNAASYRPASLPSHGFPHMPPRMPPVDKE